MYAVIRTGGKQYRVAPNDVIQVERLSTGPGESVDFDEVLQVGEGAATTAGTPLVKGAMVRAEVLEEVRGEKIIVFKKKRRQGYRRKRGHRQNLTVLRITDITGADGKTVSAPKAQSAGKTAVKAKPAAKAKAPDKKAGAKPKTEAKATETRAKAEPKAAASKPAAPKKKAAGTAAKAGAAKTEAAPKAKSTKTAAKSAPKKGSAKEKK